MLRLLLGLTLLHGAEAPAAFAPDAAPPALAAPIQRAEIAVKHLQQRLQAALAEALRAGGPGAAVVVCRDKAPALAGQVAREEGVSVGRTSARRRNPGNAPPPWASVTVAAADGKRAEDVRPVAFDLGDRVGLLRPIAVGAPCLACHGPRATLAPEVRDVLAKAYPADRAVDYATGDLRGFFWAEARK
ncbi:MAG TPA: DUF3365 domain-containing protein [Anaeromyxobacteraceae bacterium]|nr:DUF3365 domain-containing protein [Anaeromyxobacteraceae bacterium]